MADKARLLDLDNQSPVIQLFAAVVTVMTGGTLLFYLFLFSGSLVFGASMSEMLAAPGVNAGSREESILKYLQVAQQISMFIIPAIILSVSLRRGNESFLGISKLPDSIPIVLVVLLAFLLIPVTSFTGILNSRLVLPEWMAGFEDWMQTKEDLASGLTGLLIKSSGMGELFLNIVIVAVIPSIAEEMMFRGILQQIFIKLFRSGHFGIWVTAILFSAIHLQFFGFLPRLILGLSFGYLYFWSRNLWIPVIAHLINNAVPVIISYFIGWKELNEKTSDISGSQIMLPLFGAVLSIVVLYLLRNEYTERSKQKN
jgi:membrane protease YdiL (CAAX protease family)